MALVLVAVLVDLDTGDRLASLVGAVVSAVTLAISVYTLNQPAAAAPVAGPRSVQAGGGIGRAVTGDNNQLSGSAPHIASATGSPGSPQAGDGLAVPGERGVASQGNVGEAVTGDGNQQP
ncbi:hypothetical protein ACWGF2_19935 [Streptomyces sp. NPDC054919]